MALEPKNKELIFPRHYNRLEIVSQMTKLAHFLPTLGSIGANALQGTHMYPLRTYFSDFSSCEHVESVKFLSIFTV